jgi:NADPH2 dehydrogenase
MMHIRRVAQLKTLEQFQEHLRDLGIDLPVDETIRTGEGAPLAQPLTVYGRTIGNRFTVLPMEGWDGTADGHPTDNTERRWQRFGLSGAKLIWGCEAVAVRHDGRANPHQLVLNPQTAADIARLRGELVRSHEQHHGRADDLYIGLQLTHSGRFARPNPNHRLEPHILYHHPLLDRKFGTEGTPLMTDDDIDRLIEDFVAAARLVYEAGFDFVDLKHCHGYLGHEFLSAYDREGRYGGSFENRTRFLRNLAAGIRAAAPGLQLGVRLNAFDWIPFRPGADRTGEPEAYSGAYRYAFGGDGTGTGLDLTEPKAFLDLCADLGIRLVCVTGGSPYYTPHIQRPALFPPSDGYLPPEDPLLGVARQIGVTAELKRHRPDMLLVGSGYSYLQEWFANVAQGVIRQGWADSVGLGRMILAYPELPADILAGHPYRRKLFCRTFSDCTTAPRNGLVSGCYPLDDYYKQSPQAAQLAQLKQEASMPAQD